MSHVVAVAPGHDVAEAPPLNPDWRELQTHASQAAELLKLLSHPDRLLLCCQLAQGEWCVSDLEQMTGIAQPSLSQQLGILRKEGVVTTRRDGRHIYYVLSSEPVQAVMMSLAPFFCQKQEH